MSRSDHSRQAVCRSCGACCIPSQSLPIYVHLDDEDVARLPKNYAKHVSPSDALATRLVTIRTGPLAGSEACVCVALRGSPANRVSCAVYKQRPTLCVEFEPGSLDCDDAREAIGMERLP